MDINGSLARRLKRGELSRRVGVAGYRAFVKVTHRGVDDPVLVNTLAKAGTHMVMSLLDAFPEYRFAGRHYVVSVIDLDEPQLSERLAGLTREMRRVSRGQYMSAHLAHHRRVADAVARQGMRQIHVVRDPRALVVSGALYMRSYGRHPLHDTVTRRFSSEEDVVRGVITGFEQDGGTRHLRPMRERLDAFVPWLQEPGALVIRFEDLVGPSGGGTREQQLKVVRDVREALGLTADDQSVQAAADATFDSRAATFRSGEIEGWRRHLDGDLLNLLERECGDVAARLGYDW